MTSPQFSLGWLVETPCAACCLNLQPKEEVLLLGWSVPMPIPVRSRRYAPEFWKELLGEEIWSQCRESLKELGF